MQMVWLYFKNYIKVEKSGLIGQYDKRNIDVCQDTCAKTDKWYGKIPNYMSLTGGENVVELFFE